MGYNSWLLQLCKIDIKKKLYFTRDRVICIFSRLKNLLEFGFPFCSFRERGSILWVLDGLEACWLTQDFSNPTRTRIRILPSLTKPSLHDLPQM